MITKHCAPASSYSRSPLGTLARSPRNSRFRIVISRRPKSRPALSHSPLSLVRSTRGIGGERKIRKIGFQNSRFGKLQIPIVSVHQFLVNSVNLNYFGTLRVLSSTRRPSKLYWCSDALDPAISPTPSRLHGVYMEFSSGNFDRVLESDFGRQPFSA